MSESQSGAKTAPLTSNLKMLALLDELATIGRPVGASELARRVGASRSIVHRQLVTLATAGWLEGLENGTYRLTLRPMRLARAALQHSGLSERIADRLRAAADELSEVISLGAIDSDAITVLDRALPSRNVRVSVAHGHRFPIDGSALGLVLTAYLERDEYDRLVAAGVDVPTQTELREVRAAGYATVIDDDLDPIEVVAVPVGRLPGEVKYSICAHWPKGRTNPKRAIAVLEPAARDIEELVSLSAALT